MNQALNNDNKQEWLASYLAGEATPEVAAAVEAWLDASEDNQQEFEQFKLVWQLTRPVPEEKVNVDAAWLKLKSRMSSAVESPNPTKVPVESPAYLSADTAGDSTGTPTTTKIRKLNPITLLIRIAAVLIFGVMLLMVIEKFTSPDTPQMAMVTKEGTLQDTLPDGTVVILNKNSRLTYPAQFSGVNRQVALTGEAWFDVERDTTMPFIITAGATEVEVLGTSFNVSAYPDEAEVEVVVQTGKVRMAVANQPKEKAVTLTPGKRGRYNKESKTLDDSDNNDPSFLFWKGRTLVFKNTDLEKVIEVLSELYQVEVTFKNDEIKACLLSTTFHNEQIDSILDVIADTFSITVKKDSGKYELEGLGCS